MDFYEAFAHTWGSTGTVDESLTTTQYNQGWNFIGARPPRLGEFNKREKLIDQRLKWLYDQLKTAADAHGVTLAGADVGGLRAILQNLTGVPKAPTAAAGTNTTQIATTAFVQTALTGVSTTFASSAENAAGTVENKAVDPLGIREAFNASGSAPVYACRAWVNFDGTGTVAIRASGNVSSITDNGAGNYTVNFAAAMPHANYSPKGNAAQTTTGAIMQYQATITDLTTSSLRVTTNAQGTTSHSLTDNALVCVSVFC